MDLVTTQCGRYGHPEFLLQAEGPAAEASLVELLRGLESMVAGGSKFRPGQSFLVGWMPTQVVQHDRDLLTLHEPDMQSMPVRLVAGITQTLQSMMVQKFTLESVGLADQMDLPSAQHYLTVCDRFQGQGFFMARRARRNQPIPVGSWAASIRGTTTAIRPLQGLSRCMRPT